MASVATKWFNEDESKKNWINVKPWEHIPKDFFLLALRQCAAHNQAPQLLFEFQISFFIAPATHYKNQVFIIIGSEKEREVKKGQII